MSHFTELKHWYWQGRNKQYITTKEVKWEIGVEGSSLWVTVPKGFNFDVSVPKALTWLVDPHNPKYFKAACLHDYALHELNWDRVSAAALFSEALRAEKLNSVLRLLMVYAVIGWNWK
ncbi:tail assembly chaperone [Bacteriophage DSS3_VP1]|uniref:DUF1353 domain-containing protein n=1 Tax=Bacteriophage DSS3_VP1 TaxID=2664196 RepID=A0A7S5FQ99_9CAUD|nr:tail assembly chaperone [Bacteriophage DSS3_VP1]QGH74591.1 hypothetical protein DSS3VP1_00022 [Bacteriophage DSS3_VP1]